MSKKIFVPLLSVAFALTFGLRASAQGLNGTDARPVYVIAHNPNTVTDALFALQCVKPGDPCANALEPDLIVLPNFPPPVDLLGHPDPAGIVVYHDYVSLTSRVPQTLIEYLQGIHTLALQYPRLAMIQLDVKSSAATPEYGSEILSDVRTYLNTGGVNLNVIINVGFREDEKVFNNILGILGEREGVQVDGDDRADLIVDDLITAFDGNIVNVNDGNIGYGDGTLGPGPNLPRAIDLASFLRASIGYPKVISDVFTIEFSSMMSFYIDAGADGIIPDFPDALHNEFDAAITPGFLAKLTEVVNQHPEVRLATRADNPFKPENQAYGLKVRTMNTATGGTDAPLTFTLEGCRGSSSVTVAYTGLAPNAIGTNRMEAGNTDHVTIPSLNLGKLTKLHIFNQGGVLNAPNWDLQDVALSSARWLFPDNGNAFEYRASWNKTIPGNSTATLDLAPAFPEPPPTIECPAPITANNDSGKCSAVVNFATQTDGLCPSDITAMSTPKSGTAFNVGTNQVSSTATSTNPPGSASCSFTVTVKDTEGPLITCPGPQVVKATSALGALVTFAPVAADNCSANVTSAPASGSEFAIGTTTVNSVAQDPSGNQSSCSFTVHVKGAAEQLNDLITVVNNLAINDGNKNALLVKLNAALAKISGGNKGPICGPLADFISLVGAQLGKKEISVSDGNYLIAQATQIRAVVGC
jgi:hypothetical protein